MTTDKLLPYGYIYSSSTMGGSRGCLLELRSDKAGLSQDKTLNDFIKELLKFTVDSQAVLYLDRKSIPLDVVRAQERLFWQEAENKGDNATSLGDRVKKELNDWYCQVCLMEQTYRQGDNSEHAGMLGSTLTYLGKELGCKIKISRLIILATGS